MVALRAACFAAPFLLVAGLRGGSADAAGPQVERIAGGDRYETAAAVAERFPIGREVYVASGENFPDSLAAGPAVGREVTQDPILLVTRDSIPSVTQAELRRIAPSQIIVVGGTAAVSAEVATSLQSFTRGRVLRLAGADRYETAIAVDQYAFEAGHGRFLQIVTGRDFPDALLAGAAGAVKEMPLLLVDGQTPLTTGQVGEIRRLAPTTITINGDTSVISADVEAQLAELAPVVRLTESVFDRGVRSYDTENAAGNWDLVLVTGGNFPDGLSAAGFAGLTPGRLTYLVRSDCVPRSVMSEIARLNPQHITLIGGPAALSTNVEQLVPCQ